MVLPDGEIRFPQLPLKLFHNWSFDLFACEGSIGLVRVKLWSLAHWLFAWSVSSDCYNHPSESKESMMVFMQLLQMLHLIFPYSCQMFVLKPSMSLLCFYITKLSMASAWQYVDCRLIKRLITILFFFNDLVFWFFHYEHQPQNIHMTHRVSFIRFLIKSKTVTD